MTRATLSRLGRMFTAEVGIFKIHEKIYEPEDFKEKYTGDNFSGKSLVAISNEGKKIEVERRVTVTRKPHIDMAVARSPITFVYGGVELTEMVAPGQIINKRKAYKRYMERTRPWRNKR